MSVLGKAFTITGVINTVTPDSLGLESTEAEKKHCDSIIANVSGHIGNTIQVWLDREKRFEIYDYSLDTAEASGTNMYKSVEKLKEIPVDLDIPVGSKLVVQIACGGTAKNLFGTYVYHLL